MNKNIPIFRVKIDDLDPEQGLGAVSLVDFPAVEKDFITLAEQKERIKMAADEERHLVTGVALLADTPIYRRKGDFEYYIVFTTDVIRQLVTRYHREGKVNIVNFQHDEHTYTTEAATMVESYFTDKERGIYPQGFGDDIPDGSWIVTYHINDEALWDEIKGSSGEGGLNGFSVEVCSEFEEVLTRTEKAPQKVSPSLEDAIEGLLVDKFRYSRAEVREAIDSQRQLDVETEDGTIRCQIKDLGRKDGVDIANVYLPEENEWRIINLDDIQKITITDFELAPWEYPKSYTDIINDDSVVITDSIVASRENIIKAIEDQRFVMITYDDESGMGCTGSRQVQIVAYGHHKDTGNEVFRAYQYYGATHTNSPDWKLFLTKRVKSFRIMTWMEKWTSVAAGYHMDDAMIDIEAQVDDRVIG